MAQNMNRIWHMYFRDYLGVLSAGISSCLVSERYSLKTSFCKAACLSKCTVQAWFKSQFSR